MILKLEDIRRAEYEDGFYVHWWYYDDIARISTGDKIKESDIDKIPSADLHIKCQDRDESETYYNQLYVRLKDNSELFFITDGRAYLLNSNGKTIDCI